MDSEEVVLVTGGAGGIGRETAIAFGERGAAVVVADIDADEAEATADAVEDETPGEALALAVDVTDDTAVEAMVDGTVEEFGRLDAAVNNAAVVGRVEPTTEYSEDDWQQVIDVNLSGVFRSLKHELAAMAEGDGGAIVNTASILGHVGYEDACAYIAAKHGVRGLTKATALEYADDGIRVNAVSPGFTETSMLDETGVNQSERVREYIRGKHPVDRFGDPSEIAAAITWLCSDEASFVTGTALPVDGGYLAQ